MINKALKKIIIFVTVFMLVFSNCGYTLQALAATDGITLFGLNLFGSGNIDFDVYFLDENGKKQTESISDVNSKVTMVLEVTPKADGYLKSGTIKAASEEEGEANFKFDEVFVENQLSEESLMISSQADTTLLQSEMVVNAEEQNSSVENTEAKNTTVENLVDEDENTVTEPAVSDETSTVEPEETNSVPTEESVVQESTEDTAEVTEATEATEPEEVTEDTEITEPEEVVEEFVDEEAALKEEEAISIIQSTIVADATVVSDNEIKIENIIENTKIYVNISFKTGETLDVKDLYKAIKLDFEGTYINIDLEEVPINISETVNVGWEYTKDIEVSSEYTKVSPFKIGETEGTIVEDTITVTREITEDKYLPLKETKITLNVPSLAGNAPSNLDVSTLKLKATSGEDVNEVVFTKDNWEYDTSNNTLKITVQNTKGQFTYGDDVYVVTLRYDTYVDEKEVDLSTSGTVKVTEYSGKNNNEIVKELNKNERVIANVGELITYTISSKEDKIGKGKINANYNQDEEKYESDFDTTVNVNILTNDVLSEFTLKDTKEFYVDKSGLEFETTDVKYKKIKFRYIEIQDFLENGGSVEIKNDKGELLYTLNKDLVNSDENAEIAIQGDVRGVEISFKNITVNGNISIEFTKAIGKSSYDKSAFANFQKLESRINAIVKYSEDSEGTELVEIKTEKEFEESKTEAEIEMNQVSLSSTELNQNVEFKIELNNDKEDSDLYVNPIFEIALPKYVTNIDMKAVNILYEAGLSVGNITVYRADDGTQRIRIEVNGTQTEFSEGTITNGTNIIINTNIELDKYAPRKDDQIKLYYINQGVTNYVSQTKWTLGVDVPTGILKTTNGFDSYVFKVNAPTGFLTINEIQNYDGENSVVTSIRQGEETREVEMNKASQVARMNLIAINNTENKCTDVAFLGRVPVKGVTDVRTGKVLETNIDTTMLSRITEDEENPLSAKIYYSQNANADKNLNDSSNGWTEDLSGLSTVKSFLIVPDNTVEPGYKFKYTYEFMIPENLPYEAKIYGSFGVFYNNHSDVAITYETSSADLVGVVTQAGPKVEAKLTVDIGDGASVLEGRKIKYTIVISNLGSIDLENISVSNKIPKNTNYLEDSSEEADEGGTLRVSDKKELTFEVKNLRAGELKEFTYYVKTGRIPSLVEYAAHFGEVGKDDQGVYYLIKKEDGEDEELEEDESLELEETNENLEDSDSSNENEEITNIEKKGYDKVYVQTVPDIYIENQAVVESPVFANKIESNRTKNKLVKSNFVTEFEVEDEYRDLEIGFDNSFRLRLSNNSGNVLNNVEAIFKSASGMRFVSGTVGAGTGTIDYDEKTNDVVIKLGNLQAGESRVIDLNTVIDNIPEYLKNVECYFELHADGIQTEYTEKYVQRIVKSNLEAQQESSIVNGKVKEDEEVIVKLQISNTGATKTKSSSIETTIAGDIELQEMKYTGSQNRGLSNALNNGKVVNVLPVLAPNESIIIEIKLLTKNVQGNENKKISIENIIHNEYQDDIILRKVNFDVENNLLTEEEEENKKIEEYKKYQEELREKEQKEREQNEQIEQNESQSSSSDNNNLNNFDNISNNSNNSDNNSKNNNNEDNNIENEITETQQSEEIQKYEISGLSWKDENSNGSREDNEKGISGIKVYLYDATTNNMIKSITTDGLGNYTFRDVEKGRYIVGFDYDIEKYKSTIYKSENVSDDRNSDVIENNNTKEDSAKAVTDYITIENDSIYNIDIGLQDRNNFDLTISKYLVSGKVSYKNKEEIHDFDKVELAKLELDAKKIEGSVVELEYLVLVKNEGNVSGRATVIVDYLPIGTSLVNEKSLGWYIGANGNVYNESLKDIVLKPGETKELKIAITKNMDEENTGVLVNKVEINRTDNTSTAIENNSNNTNTQEVIISIKTGHTISYTIFALIIIESIICATLVANKKIKVDLKNFKIHRIYK